MSCRVNARVTIYEEDFFVFEGRGPGPPEELAEALSRREEHSYPNTYGEMATWELDRVIDVSELDVARFVDGTWLYARSFPRVSRLAERNTDNAHVVSDGLREVGGEAGWSGAMLLFRVLTKPAHEEERLLLLRADSYEHGIQRALQFGRLLTTSEPDRVLLGLFDTFPLLSEDIESGAEVYSRFYMPSELKDKERPPRQPHLIVPRFVSSAERIRATA